MLIDRGKNVLERRKWKYVSSQVSQMAIFRTAGFGEEMCVR
jgi:hypothetical protein